MTRIVVVGCYLLVTGLVVSSAVAQDRGKLDLYGQGVHAFFAEEYEQAIKHFDEVIAAKEFKDARPYYFRGLSKRLSYMYGVSQRSGPTMNVATLVKPACKATTISSPISRIYSPRGR